MQDKLIATLTRTRDCTPLATVSNLPGQDADLTPDELRVLANALLQISEYNTMPG
jgi:hypothetical protein